MPNRPIERVLRAGLVPGPHPEDEGAWLVLDPPTGNVYELSEVVWAVAEALDGTSSATEIAERLEIGRRHVQEVLRRLEELELLTEPGAAPIVPTIPPPQWRRGPLPESGQLRVHPQARFQCVGVGVCCERGYVIPVRGDQVEGLRAAARARGQGARDPVTLWPAEPGEPWGYALDNDEGCVFLDEAARCAIHGDPAQPDACGVFPLVFARVDDAIIVSLSHRCGCGVGDQGPRLGDNVEDVKDRLRKTPHVPAVPSVTRVDARREAPTPAVVEAFTAAALEAPAGAPWAVLEAALAGLGVEPGTRGSSLDALTETLAPALGPLTMTEPPVSADALRARLGDHAPDPTQTAADELGRFLRDHLFGLRPYQQVTLTHGLALLAVVVAHVLARAEDAVEARAWMMAWDDIIPQTETRAALAAVEAPITEDLAALLAAVRERSA